MFASYTLGVGRKIVSELTQEPAPGRVEEPCIRAELLELAHHCRLAEQRRIQTTNHFEQETICFVAAIDLDASRDRRFVLSSFDQSTVFGSIQKENSAQASLPLEAIKHGRHLSPGLVSQIEDDQLVYHAKYSKKSGGSIVIGLSLGRGFLARNVTFVTKWVCLCWERGRPVRPEREAGRVGRSLGRAPHLLRSLDATGLFDDNRERINGWGDIDGKKIEGTKGTQDRTSAANQTLSEGVAQADQRVRQAKGEVYYRC